MYKVTVYMVDDSFDSYVGGESTIVYGENSLGVYEYDISDVGHMFYTLTDLNGIKASYGFHPSISKRRMGRGTKPIAINGLCTAL